MAGGEGSVSIPIRGICTGLEEVFYLGNKANIRSDNPAVLKVLKLSKVN